MDSATEELALQKILPFMGSVKAKRFKGVHELVSSNVTKPGQWEAAFNKDTRELYVHYWSRYTNVGKKSVLSNVMQPNPRRGRSRTFLIPAYNAYKEMFSVCDSFNRNLKDRSWPMRFGGHGVYAEPRVEHNLQCRQYCKIP